LQADGRPYIETLARRGYRFAAPVRESQARTSDDRLHVLLAPYRAFVDGRAALETLERAAVERARVVFAEAVAIAPDHPSAHIGMANACVLSFEATHVDAHPDLAALTMASTHAREGCRLDPASAEAWSTQAFVLYRTGEVREAIAAARHAVTLAPTEWRHHLRLSFVSWGEQRLNAAHRVLALCPGLALAHWLAATVFIARHAFDEAHRELESGCAAQDAQRRAPARFGAVGLHLLRGFVLAAEGAEENALAEFARELAFEDAGHVYARESCANAWYAIGAIHLRQGRREDAAAAFDAAIARAPRHALARVGLAAASDANPSVSEQLSALSSHRSEMEIAIVGAVCATLLGSPAEGAAIIEAALADAEPGAAAWQLPVEPLLHVTSAPHLWAQPLAMIRARAT
jgi:tetratricopeptide (TPR) repeat protein